VGLCLLAGACAAPGEDSGDGTSELASDPVAPGDLIGYYDPTGAYLHNPQIVDWGGSPLLKGAYLYGDALYPVAYVLQPVAGAPSQYSAQSSLAVAYGPNRCSYPIEIQVNAVRDAGGAVNLYVRDNTPGSIPALIPVGAPCPPVQNAWRVHERPYVKRGAQQMFGALLDDLCSDITSRASAVEGAKRLAAGPMGALPANIYQASGDWQALSSPGRDQRLRASFRNVHSFVKDQVTTHELATELTGIWNQHVSACRFQYKTSSGGPVPFTLNDVQARLFDLSFDPYQCTEMRWGAYPSNPAEFATCNTQSDAYTKRFHDETSMRNIIDRPAAGTPTPLGTGPAEHEDVDVPALLQRLAQ
jgi:hypothetical protein